MPPKRIIKKNNSEPDKNSTTKFQQESLCPLAFASKFPGSLYLKDLDGKYLWVNEHVAELAGKQSITDVIGKDDYELFSKRLADQCRKNDKEVINNKKQKMFEEIIRSRAGKNLIYLGYKSPLLDKKGNVVGVLGNSLNVSEQKKFTNVLKKKSEAQEKILYYLSNFANNLPGSIYFKNVKGEYLWCNDFVIRMAGKKSITEIVGKTDYELCWKNFGDDYRKHDLAVINSKEPRVSEETLILTDGSQVPLLTHKSPIFDEKGKIIGIMGNSLDITDRKKLEITLKKAKENAEAADRAKTRFVANMSHDIRTPLAGMVGMSKIIEQEITSAKGKQATQHLTKSITILLDLLNGILEFSKFEQGELPIHEVTFNLRELIDEVVVLVAPSVQEKNINLIIKYDEKIPKPVMGDKTRIQRIVLNLVDNAIKFSNQGSIILAIALKKQSPKEIIVKISVKDTGIGIAEDKQQVIFSKFGRLTPAFAGIYKGYGLGLSTVKQFVAELNGEIDVKSKEGKGSTFTCVIPLKKSLLNGADAKIADYHASVEADLSRSPLQKYRVLLVEDNELAQWAAKHQLEQLCCQVELASDGKTALSLVKKNNYDMVFMDIGLPDKSGCDVTAEIRQWEQNKNKHTPIVALTAHVDKDNKQQCIQAGMEQVLTKPLDEQEARDVLAEYSNKLAEIDSSQEDSVKAIDLEAAQKKFGFDKNAAMEMLALFMQSLSESLANVQMAYQQLDWEKLRFHVHKLHGGAIYCGVPPLQGAAMELELALDAKSTAEDLNKLYLRFLKEIERLKAEYERFS